MDNPITATSQLFGNFLMALLGEDIFKRRKEIRSIKCPGCGITWDDFQNTGLFGCDICYQSFHEDLKVILRRIHGSNQHIGSRPKVHRHVVDETELERLQLELKHAIENEHFEKAAELRDIVRDAQREIDKRDNNGIRR
ncbi:MAG: UvrB/UvrC motif-containing protein [bacterium]